MPFQMFVDKNGVPYGEYGIYKGLNIGRQTSILSVAERGLYYWNNFLKKDYEDDILLSYDWNMWPKNKNFQPLNKSQAETYFINCINFLMTNVQSFEVFSAWIHPYQFSFNTSKNWKSSHAQAVGLSLLARSMKMNLDKCSLSDIEILLEAFKIPINRGGLLDSTKTNQIWYSKIACASRPSPYVLNGFMFTIISLYDVYNQLNCRKALEIANNALTTLTNSLDSFDCDGWSYYSLADRKPCTIHYHEIHVKQLKIIYDLTRLKELVYWEERWRESLNKKKSVN